MAEGFGLCTSLKIFFITCQLFVDASLENLASSVASNAIADVLFHRFCKILVDSTFNSSY